VAAVPHDQARRLVAKSALRFPPVEISGVQARAIVEGFAVALAEADYQIHACAVLPDHVHLVIGWHPRNIRQIVGHLKAKATRRLKQAGLWNDRERPIWGAHGWNVYLDSFEAVRRAIRYVERNPLKEGKRLQRWSIVTPFNYAASRNSTSQATRLNERQIGGAALRSRESKKRSL
jgi:REP element-mobilizing transposase RayT